MVDVLVAKTIAAARRLDKERIAVSGGVSCNTRLRVKFREACEGSGIQLLIAEPLLCTDNAAMIAFIAMQKLQRGESSPLAHDIDPNLRLTSAVSR